MKIVLLGSLPKGDVARKSWTDWKTEYVEKISSQIPDAELLHGDLVSDKEGAEVVVGHDLYLIQHSDMAIVHAVSKIGAGTAQEILMAKIFKKPVVIIIPKDSHHRKSNLVFGGKLIKDFINPFLLLSSDYVAQDLNDAIKWIKKFKKNPKMKIKDVSVMEESIKTFTKKLPKVAKAYKKSGW